MSISDKQVMTSITFVAKEGILSFIVFNIRKNQALQSTSARCLVAFDQWANLIQDQGSYDGR